MVATSKCVILPTANSVLDCTQETKKKKVPRFCTYDCARDWVMKHYPPALRHEVLTLIDIVSGRLVGLVEDHSRRPSSSSGSTRIRPKTAPTGGRARI